jgi:thioredoxin 1
MIVLYIVLGVVALFLTLQFSMIIKMKFKKGKPVPEINGKAGQIIQKGGKVLFYFYSPNCRACKEMTPQIKQLSKRNKGIFPIDISKDMNTAKKFGVMGTPATVLVKAGKIKEYLMGPQSESKIVALING